MASLMEISNLAAKDPVMAKELLLAVRCAVGEDNIMDMLDVAPKDDAEQQEATPHKLPVHERVVGVVTRARETGEEGLGHRPKAPTE